MYVITASPSAASRSQAANMLCLGTAGLDECVCARLQPPPPPMRVHTCAVWPWRPGGVKWASFRAVRSLGRSLRLSCRLTLGCTLFAVHRVRLRRARRESLAGRGNAQYPLPRPLAAYHSPSRARQPVLCAGRNLGWAAMQLRQLGISPLGGRPAAPHTERGCLQHWLQMPSQAAPPRPRGTGCCTKTRAVGSAVWCRGWRRQPVRR
jgi:hypothetical protein